jgi:hypothetical protein
MTIDLEADLRREFDAATPPGGLAFDPESVLRQGSRTVRRRRIIAAGSAAMAVALVATGATLLTRPSDTAAPQPATHTPTTGIARVEIGVNSGETFRFEINRDPKVTSNLKLSVLIQGPQPEKTGKGPWTMEQQGPVEEQLGRWSIGKPGHKPDAIWKSGLADGHPYTVGLVPGSGVDIAFAKGASYGVVSNEVAIAGYTMFAVDYQNGDGGDGKAPAGPAEIANISWSAPAGVVDGVEGVDRLSGRVLTLDRSVSVKVMLRQKPKIVVDGQFRVREVITVSGAVRFKTDGGAIALPLSVATTDGAGANVVTGIYPVERLFTQNGIRGSSVGDDGAPMAAGMLPRGASNIGVDLTIGGAMTGLAVSAVGPDSRVIFALKAAYGSEPSKDSIKAITWTNEDGSPGKLNVNQVRP